MQGISCSLVMTCQRFDWTAGVGGGRLSLSQVGLRQHPDALQELEFLARFWHHFNLYALFHPARIIIFLCSMQNAGFLKGLPGPCGKDRKVT